MSVVAELDLHRPQLGPGVEGQHQRRHRPRTDGGIRRRGRQKRGLSGHTAGGWCPIAANQRWSLDFTEDCLANGRQFRTANLKDDCTRDCPAIAVDFSLPGQRVVGIDAAVHVGDLQLCFVDGGFEGQRTLLVFAGRPALC